MHDSSPVLDISQPSISNKHVLRPRHYSDWMHFVFCHQANRGIVLLQALLTFLCHSSLPGPTKLCILWEELTLSSIIESDTVY